MVSLILDWPLVYQEPAEISKIAQRTQVRDLRLDQFQSTELWELREGTKRTYVVALDRKHFQALQRLDSS